MTPMRNILTIVDPTANDHPAVAKAAILAERFGARMELFICETRESRRVRHAEHAREACNRPFVIDLKSMLESLAEPLRSRGIDVATETVCADPLPVALLEHIEHGNADLVIKDTHHHSIARRSFLTNTDWELIRGCSVPLLLTKRRPWPANPCICAAVDPGHHGDKPLLLDRCILDRASAFAKSLDADLHVVHAYTPMSVVAAAASVPPMTMDVSTDQLASERKARLTELTALVSDYRVPSDQVHMRIGSVDDVLCRVARQVSADVMTMGAVSRSGLKQLVIGSSAESVLEHLPCDALIVKTANISELPSSSK